MKAAKCGVRDDRPAVAWAHRTEDRLASLSALLPVFLLIAAFASHVLPHPWWNFTAVGASLLVWGARRSPISAFVPVGLLALGDWYLTEHVYNYRFHVSDYLVTWAWYGLVVALGYLLLRGKPGIGRLATAGVLAPTSFFLASNYAVWASPGSWYPHTLAGLEACYVLALPFYRNDLIATSLVLGLVWGLPALVAQTRHAGEVSARGRVA
jgi:hypothetical protein